MLNLTNNVFRKSILSFFLLFVLFLLDIDIVIDF